MTTEEIVASIARMSIPNGRFDAHDSDQVLARLILEARRAVSAGRRRKRAQVYAHQRAAFARSMLLVEDAPADELRDFAADIIDLLWGAGSAESRRHARSLDVDKEWEVETVEEVAFALSRCSFYPFKQVRT